MADSKRPKPTVEQLARYAEAFNSSATMRAFGVRIHFPEGERVRVDMDAIRPEHRGGLGSPAVNGGVIAAMFDLAIGCTPALVDPTRKNATMQLSMSFMRPLTGDRFHVEAVIDRAGGETLFASAKVFDEKDRVCAQAQGLVKLSDEPWSGGDSPAVN